ncbi:hypothetical protein N2603_11780 [Bradyrhizobium huanghuaihaiense]|uniref:hypothetical protein n=1 Tax=Bradyrhizobium huanghuaihaiense TaxID=990078 RepID=UPI0021AA024F|nr:hypothetical protein [Bradyrhizobium sp. CB3035]UWU79103.1 hypothetical protein N2603_11780 [Bradyrhizobium sp. CB3035]
MQIAHRANGVFAEQRAFDSWIMLGYAAFAAILLMAIYFASAGSGVSAENIAVLPVLP